MIQFVRNYHFALRNVPEERRSHDPTPPLRWSWYDSTPALCLRCIH